MTDKDISTLIESEREQLTEGRDDISDAVTLRPDPSTTVAKGLLVQGHISEAQAWFDAVSDEWLQGGERIYETKFEQKNRQKAQQRPWHEYVMSLLTGLLGRTGLSDTAMTIADRVSAPFVDGLEQRSITLRIDLAGLLVSVVLKTDSWESYASNLLPSYDMRDEEWVEARYPPYVAAAEGIRRNSLKRIETGIEGLISFHDRFVAGARDASVVDASISLDACAVLALARRKGIAVTVEHEVIPDALNDPEYYPISGQL